MCLALVVGALGFTSCGDDDDNIPNGNESGQLTGDPGASVKTDGNTVTYCQSAEGLKIEYIVTFNDNDIAEKSEVKYTFASSIAADATYKNLENNSVIKNIKRNGNTISADVTTYIGLTKDIVITTFDNMAEQYNKTFN